MIQGMPAEGMGVSLAVPEAAPEALGAREAEERGQWAAMIRMERSVTGKGWPVCPPPDCQWGGLGSTVPAAER